MAIEILRDLRGLRIEVMHPADTEGSTLIDHLRRIGCITKAVWPLPKTLDAATDLVVTAVDHDSREPLRRLFRDQVVNRPTIIGIVGYENPSILQLVLEIGAQAIIERPVRPFGLLTQLAIARSLWLRQQEDGRRLMKLERKLAGVHKIQRARLILMAEQRMSEEQAYQSIRRQAMTNRLDLEAMAALIIDAHDHLRAQASTERIDEDISRNDG